MADDTVSHENVRATNVTGTNVYNVDGDHLGHVDDIVIGKLDGKVKYAILSIGGFLGIGEEYHPLPWAELDYQERLNGFVINRSREQLESAPRYAAGNEPNWSDRAYGESVYGYYGRLPYV
jgi:sporulation protein YlmC with PRC-barrel domain